MDEYIKREELRKTLETWRDAHADVDDEDGWELLEDVLRELNAQATADVAPVVHGHWIDNGAGGYKWAFVCSRCGYVDGHPFDDRHNFCPNCGAKMDGGAENGALRSCERA